MCFSATASFVTAAATGAVGLATAVRTERGSEVPLATIPLFFAAQQLIEGLLWLNLPVDSGGTTAYLLTDAFLVFALVFWPVFAPLAAYLVEPHPLRRWLMGLCTALGAGVAMHFLWSIVDLEHTAAIKEGHIVYQSADSTPIAFGILYLMATTLAPLASSLTAIRLLGVIVLAGSVTAYFIYWEAFVSVWCFFAAAASIVILGHFEHRRAARARQSAVRR